MKTLLYTFVIAATIGGVIVGGNYGIRKFAESDELAIYKKLHTPTPGVYYQVTDIGSPVKDGGKQFLNVIELFVAVTNSTKSGESVIELRPTGKCLQIEVPIACTGTKSPGSITTVIEGNRTKYFVSSHEAIKNLLGIQNEKL